MKDFSHLSPPSLRFYPGGVVDMITFGDPQDYRCPDCGNHLCWLDMVQQWYCPECETEEDEDDN